MKAGENPSSEGMTSSQQIDAIIEKAGDWRGNKLSQLRALIKKADPAVIEEVKGKSPPIHQETQSGLMMESYASEIRSRTP